jgi:hypothetical protein
MGDRRDELRRPIGFGFFVKSAGWFLATAATVGGIAPLQPDVQKFATWATSGRWNLPLLLIVWWVVHLVVECVKRQLELERELLRSDPKMPRISAKRTEVKKRRKQNLKTRR